MNSAQLRIAVVEDDVFLREPMLEFLEKSGHDVWGASNASELYRQMLVHPVDVVILDVSLPGEDGFSAARHLRRLENLLLVIVSPNSALDDRLNGMSAGADLYLSKPVDLPQLNRELQALAAARHEPPTASQPDYSRLASHAPAAGNTTPASNNEPPWRLSMMEWTLTAPNGQQLTLTAKEFRFMLALVEASGEAVSKARVAASLGSPEISSPSESNRIDVLLARLRKKGLQTFGSPLPIKTVTAYGYALSARCTLG